jgi:hypothetical protein
VRRLIATAVLAGAASITFATPAFAGQGNPSPTGTGPPSQSCQAEPMSPGHSVNSPGAPFHEPSGSDLGGIGGQNYSQSSQYDVACYHVSTNH